jgi:cytochrome c553
VLYRDGAIGATCPTPLAQRPVPPELPSVQNLVLAKRGLGEVFLSDVYEGLPKAVRGTLRQIRVVQVFPKTTRDSNAPRIGVAGEENTRAVLGVTPVEADGSARFLVPAGKPILFQALDEQGFAYQTMRSSTSLMPGERVSCVGCHENKMTVSASALKRVAAMRRPAAELTPTPESGRPYGFVENVQPIFDAKCVSCHNDKEAKAGINLSRTVVGANGYTASYETLCYAKGPDGKTVRRLSKKTGRPLVTCFPMRNQIQVTPEGGEDGARGSGLMAALKSSQEKYGLTAEELRRIATWIDLNAVYYGVYEPEAQLALQREGKPVPMPEIQ